MKNKNLDKDIRDGFFDNLFKVYKNNKKIFLLYADQGFFKLNEFIKTDASRCINMGISEQNMINVASGLSRCGNKVFVYGISPFLVLKTLEQVKLFLCIGGMDVTMVGSGTGLCYSQDGPTHHTFEDIKIYSIFEKINIYTPSNYENSSIITKKILKNSSLNYLRLDKGCFETTLYHKKILKKTNFTLFSNKKNKCIISYGPLINYLIENNFILANYDIIDLYKQYPISNSIINELNKYDKILFVEESFKSGGLFSIFQENNYVDRGKIKVVCLNNFYTRAIGDRAFLIDKMLINKINKF